VLLLLSSGVISAAGTGETTKLTNRDRAVVFAVVEELKAAHLEGKPDVCVGFGYKPSASESRIRSAIGYAVHSKEWCNKGPRGFEISVHAPIKQIAPDTFELEVQTGDLYPIVREGAHFGTELRSGFYTVRCKDSGTPELVRYVPSYPPDK